jgi:hypothetical protein
MLARVLIVLLAVLNLAVALWWWRQPVAPAPAPPPWPAAPRLQGLAAPTLPASAAPSAGGAIPPRTAAAACLRIGPFADAAAATVLRMRLPPGMTLLSQAAAGGGHWLHVRLQGAVEASALDDLAGGAGVAWRPEPCPATAAAAG